MIRMENGFTFQQKILFFFYCVQSLRNIFILFHNTAHISNFVPAVFEKILYNQLTNDNKEKLLTA